MSDCPHPTLYARDMFNQPQPWGSCPLCERDSEKARADGLEKRVAELEQYRAWADPQIVTHGKDVLRIASLESQVRQLRDFLIEYDVAVGDYRTKETLDIRHRAFAWLSKNLTSPVSDSEKPAGDSHGG